MEIDYSPKKISIVDIGINVAIAIITSFAGSLILFFCIIFLLPKFGGLIEAFTRGNNGLMLVLFFDMTFFVASTIAMSFSYAIYLLIGKTSYKGNVTSFLQLTIFSVFNFMFMFPLYFIIEGTNYYFVIGSLHVLISFFGYYIILEILNNYNYVLVGIFGAFLGFTLLATLYVYFIQSGILKTASYEPKPGDNLTVMLLVIPLVSSVIYLFRSLFNLVYYKYYTLTGTDPIGNIFYSIDKEESEFVNNQ